MCVKRGKLLVPVFSTKLFRFLKGRAHSEQFYITAQCLIGYPVYTKFVVGPPDTVVRIPIPTRLPLPLWFSC